MWRWAVGIPADSTSRVNGGEVKYAKVHGGPAQGGSAGGIPMKGLGTPPAGSVEPGPWKLEVSV
jgi:hypothetical protein